MADEFADGGSGDRNDRRFQGPGILPPKTFNPLVVRKQLRGSKSINGRSKEGGDMGTLPQQTKTGTNWDNWQPGVFWPAQISPAKIFICPAPLMSVGAPNHGLLKFFKI